jgi:hypothetical protein
LFDPKDASIEKKFTARDLVQLDVSGWHQSDYEMTSHEQALWMKKIVVSRNMTSVRTVAAAAVCCGEGHGHAPSASLNDYTNFHGMLCRPRTAKRCIDSFTGSILFMPVHYTTTTATTTLENYDCGGGITNTLTYYLLVLVTFTGLSTLLQQTEIRTVQETETLLELDNNNNHTVIRSHHDGRLKVDSSVLDYILRQHNSTNLKLTRRFDFYFGGLVPISVMMLHLTCNQGLLHLVEVYRVERLSTVYSTIFMCVATIFRSIRCIRLTTVKNS